ncbi:N-acetylmuramoyl-L-alanine amidase sle1 [Actinoplanes sp. N902-109]|nr:N-acetylmuramoyl-L-alanine amidase sle1 [Actinoplanes sp. N902-109]
MAFTATPALADTDDYPSSWRDAPMDSQFDDWGYYNRECTSWAAWRLHTRGFEMPYAVGNADGWDDWARTAGYTVDSNPTVGAVAQHDSQGGGHVAMVTAVNGSTVTISEYNGDYNGNYGERDVAASDFVYLHLI